MAQPATPPHTLIPEDWDHPLIFSWILHFRAIAVLCMVPALSAGFLLQIFGQKPFFLSLGILTGAAVSWGYGYAARRAGIQPGPWFLFWQMGFDLGVFISVLLLTGAHTNPFHPFYFVYAVLGAFWLRRVRAVGYLLLWNGGFIVLGHHYLLPYSQPFVESWLLPRLVVGNVVFACVFAVAHLLRRYRFHLAAYHRRQSYAAHLQSLGALSAGLCHQLNSPLNTAMLRLNRLQRQGLEENEDVQALARALNQCRDALQSMQEKRMAPDGLQNMPIDVPSYLEEVVRGWRQARPEREVTTEFHVEHRRGIQFPPLPVAEMVWDLLDNAGEAMQGHGRVVMTTKDEANAFTLSIRDEGPGFAERMLRSLGQPFGSEKAGGNGIGLYNAYLLMNALGGELRLENPVEGGAQVTLVFAAA